MTNGGHARGACIHSVRLFTLDCREAASDDFGDGSRVFGLFLWLFVACAFAAAGCGVKTVYLHDGKQQLDSVAVVVWSSPDPPADAPSIALAKIDDKKLAPHAAPVNRLEVLPGTHDFIMKASYPDPGSLGAHKPPPKAQKGEGPGEVLAEGRVAVAGRLLRGRVGSAGRRLDRAGHPRRAPDRPGLQVLRKR